MLEAFPTNTAHNNSLVRLFKFIFFDALNIKLLHELTAYRLDVNELLGQTFLNPKHGES